MEFDLSIMGVALEDVVARSGELLALGADGLFTAEGPHDVTGALFLAAAGAPGASLMTNAAIAFPRNPIHLAHAAFDLQRLTGGRFRLGIAPQIRAHITRRFGIEWSRPLERMGDYVDALHAIFATWQDGVPLDHRGPHYTHTLMTPMFSPSPLTTSPPPVIVGALGPAMTELAAARGDGVSVLPFTSADLLAATTLPAIERGLEAAGKGRDGIEVVCGVITAVGRDDEELEAADRGARALLGFYGSTPAYRRVLESIGREDLHEPLRHAVAEGRFDLLGSLVDDEVTERLAVVGRPQEVAARVVEKVGGLADRVALFFPSTPSDETTRELLDHLHAESGVRVSDAREGAR